MRVSSKFCSKNKCGFVYYFIGTPSKFLAFKCLRLSLSIQSNSFILCTYLYPHINIHIKYLRMCPHQLLHLNFFFIKHMITITATIMQHIHMANLFLITIIKSLKKCIKTSDSQQMKYLSKTKHVWPIPTTT